MKLHYALFAALAIVAACSGSASKSDETSGQTTATTSGAGGGTSGAGGGPTDLDRCNAACDALIACGVEYQKAECGVGCVARPVFLACLKQTSNDCNALALCAWAQFAKDQCGGGPGPAGSATCAQTATCQGTCNVSNPTAQCACACIAAMSPAAALALLVNDQCALAECPSCLPQTFNGVACNACHAQKCANQAALCSSKK